MHDRTRHNGPLRIAIGALRHYGFVVQDDFAMWGATVFGGSLARRLEPTVFGSKKHREDRRYYLLPGMGRSNRKRHVQLLRWSLAIGAIVSAIFGYVLYLVNRF